MSINEKKPAAYAPGFDPSPSPRGRGATQPTHPSPFVKSARGRRPLLRSLLGGSVALRLLSTILEVTTVEPTMKSRQFLRRIDRRLRLLVEELEPRTLL